MSENDQQPPGTAQSETGTETNPFEPRQAAETPTVIDTMVGQQVADQERGQNINAMLNVGLNVQIVLGQSRMSISQLLSLSRGSVIELDKKIGEPVDVMINDRLVARGDLVKVGDNRIGVTLTEIVKDYVSHS